MRETIFENKNVIKYWDYEKNIGLDPQKIRCGSARKVWWKCDKGHTWERPIKSQSNPEYHSCHQCSVKIRETVSENERTSKYWDYEKNKGLDPTKITCASGILAYWKCNKGHAWERKVRNQANPYYLECPVCDRKTIRVSKKVSEDESLMKYWDFKKNTIKPDEITHKSNKKVYWICENGHSLYTTPREKGREGAIPCRKCLGLYIPKKRETVLENPKLAASWDYEKNKKLDPSKIRCSSSIEAYWKCEKGHSFVQPVKYRDDSKISCPFCFGRHKTIDKTPKLIKYWDFEENKKRGFYPEDFTASSNTFLYWCCDKNHKWCCSPNSRITKGKILMQCPYCNKTKVGYENNLAYEYPLVAKRFDVKKNKITPDKISAHSHKVFWWKCDKGHTWQRSVQYEIKIKDCQKCARLIASPEYNLLTEIPDIKKIWDYEKNQKSPEEYLPNSYVRVYFKCEYGHSYQMYISDKIQHISRCPECHKYLKSSYAEQIIFYYMKKIFPEAVNNLRVGNAYEVDIYIPELSLAIEYDGYAYHKEEHIEREINKDKYLFKQNKKVIRIKEFKNNIPKSYYKTYVIPCTYNYKYDYMNFVIAKILNYIKRNYNLTYSIDIDIQRDNAEIWKNNYKMVQEKNIVITHPKIALEWDYEKNGGLKPEMFTHGSMQFIHWKCKNNHEFVRTVNARCKKNGNKCPYCINRRVSKENNLLVKSPLLAKEWDCKKNKLKPDEVCANSTKSYYWRCKKNHSWKACLADRMQGSGCPYCAGKRVSIETSIYKKCPAAMKEWDYEKNKELNPKTLGVNSNLKVYWKCKNNHSYICLISSKVKGKTCDICKKIEKQKHLELLANKDFLKKEWNETEEFSFDLPNTKIYSWKCSKKHVWEASIKARKKGVNCPYCDFRKVSKDNNLAKTNPELLEIYSQENNLLPTEITKRYTGKIIFECEKQHKWSRTIRAQLNNGCPYCERKKPSKEYNLKVLYSQVANEWDYEKNYPIRPEQIMPKTNKRFYWKCKKGHSWITSAGNRVKGKNCPICQKEKVIQNIQISV